MKPREIAKLPRADGWLVKRKGPGDHVQYAHPEKPRKVTLDSGGDPIPTGTLRSIYRQAGVVRRAEHVRKEVSCRVFMA
jgi:predicted RNA binding protein YcfA (HicA-like mRNA interferase family)